jgi:hypothetical protein
MVDHHSRKGKHQELFRITWVAWLCMVEEEVAISLPFKIMVQK